MAVSFTIKDLKKENDSKGEFGICESKKDLKNKDEEIKRLCTHNQEILNYVKKRKLHEFESKNSHEDITTKN